jgi:NAD(P)H-dependent FMN reductase
VLEPPLRLAIIVGSTRHGRFGSTVASWFASVCTARADVTSDLIELADADLPDVLPAHADPAVAAYAHRINDADAIVVVTPEYNHGYPAPLKQAIDLAHSEWHAKPVGFVSYGGISGGLRAVEQLRQVFAEVHAMTVRNSVSFHGAWQQFDEAGMPYDLDRARAMADLMLDQLVWWARALRTARALHPYAA